MTANRRMTLFVLLLNCWQEAELQPINLSSGTVTVEGVAGRKHAPPWGLNQVGGGLLPTGPSSFPSPRIYHLFPGGIE